MARGENTGRTLPHANVVHSLEKLGSWSGDATTLPLPAASGGLSTAVLVQIARRRADPGRRRQLNFSCSPNAAWSSGAQPALASARPSSREELPP